MMTKFEVNDLVDSFGATVKVIQKIEDDGTVWVVPNDPANSDYQAYLATLPSNSSTPQAGE